MHVSFWTISLQDVFDVSRYKFCFTKCLLLFLSHKCVSSQVTSAPMMVTGAPNCPLTYRPMYAQGLVARLCFHVTCVSQISSEYYITHMMYNCSNCPGRWNVNIYFCKPKHYYISLDMYLHIYWDNYSTKHSKYINIHHLHINIHHFPDFK